MFSDFFCFLRNTCTHKCIEGRSPISQMYLFLKEDKLKPSLKQDICDNITTGSARISDLCNNDTQNKTTEKLQKKYQ